MNKPTKCPMCQKVIGEMVYDGAHDSGGLGMIAMYHYKYDYRKASHICWEGGRTGKNGTICKTCARKIFPEGKAYKVTFQYKGVWVGTYGGDSGSTGLFTTKAKASTWAKDMTKKQGTQYRVEEVNI